MISTQCCRFNAEDNASPLYLTEAAEKSKFFKSLGKKVKRSLQEKPLAMENHSNGQLLCALLVYCICLDRSCCKTS